jgi:hypothetical protein
MHAIQSMIGSVAKGLGVIRVLDVGCGTGDLVRFLDELGIKANPGSGSLDAKIRPGSWVVIKPNIVDRKGTHYAC